MKILHVIWRGRYSGAEMLVRDLALRHQAGGETVGVFSLGPSESDFIAVIDELRSKRISWFESTTGDGRLQRILRLRRVVAEFQPDVIVAHAVIPGVYSRIFKLRLPCPVIVVMHDANCDDFKHFVWPELILRHRADALVAVNPRAIENYRIRFGTHPGLSCIKNGIDASRFALGLSRNSARKVVGFNSISILQVGRLTPIKRQDNTIKAFNELHRKHTGAKLYFAGVCDDEQWRKGLNKMVHDLNLTESVVFLGGRSDVPALLNAADVTVMPSDYESQGIAFLEALASGSPIVGSLIPEFAEFGDRSGVLLVNTANPIEYATAMEKLIGTEQVVRDMSLWDIAGTARSYLTLIQKVAALGKGRNVRHK